MRTRHKKTCAVSRARGKKGGGYSSLLGHGSSRQREGRRRSENAHSSKSHCSGGIIREPGLARLIRHISRADRRARTPQCCRTNGRNAGQWSLQRSGAAASPSYSPNEEGNELSRGVRKTGGGMRRGRGSGPLSDPDPVILCLHPRRCRHPLLASASRSSCIHFPSSAPLLASSAPGLRGHASPPPTSVHPHPPFLTSPRLSSLPLSRNLRAPFTGEYG